MVVDQDTGKLLGEVTGINGAHGTAIAPNVGRGFATAGNDKSIVEFDLRTFKTLGSIPAAEDADAILFDAPSNRILSLNGDAHSSTVIDVGKDALVTNIPLGGKPEYGVSAGNGIVYANLTDTSEIVEIDAKTATVTRRWSTAPCKQPVSMAIDKAHHRLFSGCRSGVMAISDYQAGKVVATVPIGTGTDGARLRPRRSRRLRLQRRRNPHHHPSGRPRQISRSPDRHDANRLPQHGPRSHQPPPLRSLRRVRSRPSQRPRQRPGSTRLLHPDDHRTRPTRTLIHRAA